MHGAEDFLKALSIVLCVAAVTTVLFQRLRQPVVLGYILAGLIIGPHVPIPLVADPNVVTTLSELGVILLMFSLGLEFRFKTLFEVGPTAALTAIIETSIMLWLGFTVGRLFGWTPLESLFCGSVVAISSTTIIARAFAEQGVSDALKRLVLGILIVEDLIAIVLMTTLTAVASGSGLSAGAVVVTVGKLALFLGTLVVIGLLVVPRAVRWVVATGRDETMLVASIGVCFLVSAAAREFGYSTALGAFIAGSLVAESGEGHRVEVLVRPVRDVFAAVFFVSVGMHIDPSLAVVHWLPIVVLVGVVIVGKSVGVSLAAFFTSGAVRLSVRAGMSLSQIGEFSFIIASLGLALGVIGPFLYPVVVIVSALTTLTTPYMIRGSEAVASTINHKLPRPLQTFTSLYASWLEQLTRTRAPAKGLARYIKLLIVDVVVLLALAAATNALAPAARAALADLGVEGIAGTMVMVVVVAIVLVPLLAGLVEVSRRLGRTLATRVLPDGEAGRLDLMATPRKAFVVTLELATVLVVGAPLLALTQPFMPAAVGAASVVIFAGAVVVMAIAFWRSAADLQGHVRAGAEVLVAALSAQAKAGPQAQQHHALSAHADAEPTLNQIDLGLGRPESVRVPEDSPVLGQSLVSLDLRTKTGASALALIRDGAGHVPDGDEALRAGDILALSGTRDAIAAARAVLCGDIASEDAPADDAAATDSAAEDAATPS